MTTNDYDRAYHEFHMQLLGKFIAQIQEQLPFCLQDCNQDDLSFLTALKQLSHIGGNDQLIQGQQLLCRIVTTYPHLMPILPRDLLWYFGGDCLHYMPDEEIGIFQMLDEQRQAAKESNKPFIHEKARLTTMGLH